MGLTVKCFPEICGEEYVAYFDAMRTAKGARPTFDDPGYGAEYHFTFESLHHHDDLKTFLDCPEWLRELIVDQCYDDMAAKADQLFMEEDANGGYDG